MGKYELEDLINGVLKNKLPSQTLNSKHNYS